MVYKHEYFSLDFSSRTIFDENGKELKLAGNAYRVLVFLCGKKSATLIEIGSYLDFAKDYDENHIRQYRYKINTIIGHDVIEYKNGVYSIIGEVKEVDKLEQNDRNTDLLQVAGIRLSQNMGKVDKIKFTKIPAIIAVVFLLLSMFPWPYAYYNFSRIVVTIISAYYAYYIYSVVKKQDFWFWVLVVAIILFNPILPIYLYKRELWSVIDVVLSVFFISLIIKFSKK